MTPVSNAFPVWSSSPMSASPLRNSSQVSLTPEKQTLQMSRIWSRVVMNYLILNLFDFEPPWFWTYFILNLSSSEPIWFWPIWFWTYLTLNLSDSQRIWFWTFLILNLSDSQPTWSNLSDFESIWCRTTKILNLSDVEPIRYRACPPLQIFRWPPSPPPHLARLVVKLVNLVPLSPSLAPDGCQPLRKRPPNHLYQS